MRKTAPRFIGAYAPRSAVPAALSGTAAWRRLEATVRAESAEPTGWFSLPNVGYPLHAGVPPVWSATQCELIRDVVQKDVVDGLNEATLGSGVESHALDVVLRHTSFDATQAHIHTKAAEHFNLAFAWRSLKPWGVMCSVPLLEALDMQIAAPGSPAGTGLDMVKRELLTAAAENDTAGWLFLVMNEYRSFAVQTYQAGTTPITHDIVPLLGFNLQYAAYYHDYGATKKLTYVANAIKAADWSVAEQNWRRSLNPSE
jgi:Fe-Mn family superoxide dismutase